MRRLDLAEQDELQIHVVGSCGTGKTTIQVLLADFLREYGFDVHVETKYEFRDERELRRHTDVYNEDRIESIRNRIKKITVNEVQSKRMISRNLSSRSNMVW